MEEAIKYRVLVVDDEVHNIDLLCHMLMPVYNVKTAKNGKTALKMVEKHNPDIILLDIVMPDMSGFEVLMELKKSDATRNIPVIFITGLDSSEDEERGLNLGAVDYITKPFHESIVTVRVRTHLQIVQQMRTIERLGMIDALTSIANRRSYDHYLNVEWGRAIREKTPLSLLMIDIDHFKTFNDTYGHAHGDAVLKNVANVISRSMRRSSDFVARWGGEEFAVLLPNTDADGAVKVAEMVRRNVESMSVTCVDGRNTSVTVSVGVYGQLPDKGSVLADFTIKADQALYSAKEAGRNVVVKAT